MLKFVRCMILATVLHRSLVLLGILRLAASNEALSGLLSTSLSKEKSEKCTMSTTHCVPIALHLNRTCLGNHLPYKLTAPIPLDEDVTFYNLEFWTALQSIPACWDKLQYFLCSVYIPECVVIQSGKSVGITHSSIDINQRNGSKSVHHSVGITSDELKIDSYLSSPESSSSSSSSSSASSTIHRVVLPEAEMCEAVHKACPLLFSIIQSMNNNKRNNVDNLEIIGNSASSSNGHMKDDIHDNTKRRFSYPKFLDCSLYTPGCRQNKLTARLFQSNGGGCQSPLVTTSLRRNWIPGIERCSFPCRRPHFDSEHYKLARWITGCAAVVCLCTNIFTLFTLRLQFTERMEITQQLSAYIHRLIDSLHLPTFSTDRKSHLIYHGKATTSSSSSACLVSASGSSNTSSVLIHLGV
ncbi:unnamed protein product [Heterobilharzia americana]|nr:unnamed protein product [Heterobilharzia americana]